MESESMWKSFIPYQGKQGPLVSVKKNGKGCCIKIICKFVNCAKNWVDRDQYFSGPNFESIVSCSQFSKYNESTTNLQIHFEKLITSLHSFT